MSWKNDFPQQNIYYETKNEIIFCNDALKQLKKFPSEAIDCVITSPPYWALRDYGIDGQIGLEKNFQDYLEKLWQVFDKIYEILKPTGTCWINLGDCYFTKVKGTGEKSKKQESNKGSRFDPVHCKMRYPEKCLCMIPERFAIGMIERGWILRNQIIWHKPNAMPQSVKDRFTVDFEKIFFFTKNKKYYFKQIKEPNNDKYKGKRGKFIRRHKKQSAMQTEGYFDYYGKGRNKRTVWSINTKPFKGAHFAVFPPKIPELCIQAGCPPNGIVLDPFFGAGTVGVVAKQLGRRYIGIELNPSYCELAKKRIIKETENL